MNIQMSDDEKAEYVTRQMALGEEYPNIFFIGRCASRLTFVSQQYRALNLIWSLHKSGKIDQNTKITIVGAGLAGLTAAYAAFHLGAQVNLIESKPDALHMQRGCEQRFIHPYILDWPEPDSEEKLFTDFPCLNWGAGMAAQVCTAVYDQWLPIEKIIKPKYGFDVREIKVEKNGKIFVLAEGVNKNYRDHCDIVILAIGFGLEKSTPAVPFLSYWENDNFGRPVITGRVPRIYYVTGCGDGGLIDAIRLQIKHFNHDKFIFKLRRVSKLEGIKERLKKIDGEVLEKLESGEAVYRIKEEIKTIERSSDPQLQKYFKDTRSIENFAKECIASIFLENAYNEIEFPDEFPDELMKNILFRRDTVVYLNSPFPSPFTLKSSVLNRFIIFLLKKFGFMRYRQGWSEISKPNLTQPYRILIRSYNYPPEVLEADEVVSRHGPNHAIDKLFPRSVAEGCRQIIANLQDSTRIKLYDDYFLNSPKLQKEKQEVRLNYAVSRLPNAADGIVNFNRFGVKIEDGKIIYYVESPTELNISQTKDNFYEFDIEFKQNSQSIIPASKPVEKLCYGAGIQLLKNLENQPLNNSPANGMASVCCFVESLKTGKKGFLTASNSIGNPESLKINDFIALASVHNENRQTVGKIDCLNLAAASNRDSNLVSDTIRFNRFDAIITEFESGVNYSGKYASDVSFPIINSLYSYSEPESDDIYKKNIFKIGAVSGFSRGIIEEIAFSVKVEKWGETFWYENLLKITGINNEPFAEYGDEGAPVIADTGELIGMLIHSVDNVSYACFVSPILSYYSYKIFLPNVQSDTL